MRLFSSVIIGLGVAAFSLCAQKSAPANETLGLPPRATPSDYQAQVKVGAVIIAAEFDGHAIPTAEGPLSSDRYVVVEAALFGAPGAKLALSPNDFSLRINGKKTPVPSEPYEMVGPSVKDPQAPTPQKSKSSFSTGGGGADSDSTAPVKVPFNVQRAMAERVKSASMAEGNRALPQAGLIYFRYGGKAQNIHSIELIYSGPAGNASLKLQP